MKELVISTKNELGTLAKVAQALGSVGVNIDAISAYGTDRLAVFRILTNDSKSALRAISKIPEITTKEADVIIYPMANRPGELGKMTKKLASSGVNLESIYIVSKKPDITEIALKPAEGEFSKAVNVLGLKQ